MICQRSTGWRHQGGFALVTAIFIVVVLALLGTMIVTIGGMERSTASSAVQSTRAFYAARSGVEWATYGALNNTVATCGAPASPPIPTTFSLAVAGLNGFTVTVTCSYTSHSEYGTPYNVFVINSTARFGSFGSTDFVSRTLRATITNAS